MRRATSILTVMLLGTGFTAATELPAAAQPPPQQPAQTVTVYIDPSYQHYAPFDGWGTSLVWFANITGGYPDEIRDQLVDMLFGEDGLRLNIARYNIGGGNAPDVRRDYMKVGATMEGFWRAPEGITREDMDWWDPDNPDHWNWDADANQRWWIDQIRDRVDTWEAFSNSPPWFQTVSGYVSGGFNPSTDQIRADRVGEFATYLVRVAEQLEDAHGIEFDTIEPLNEPNTNFWGTQLGPDGQPTGGRQEGAHAGPQLQQQVVLALAAELQGADTNAVIAAMDETNSGLFTTNWNAYGAAARTATEQLNVHTYGTNQRTSARDLAKGSNKLLYMSEVEGSFFSPTDYNSMEPGLGIATRIVDDIRELEPTAWVFWQPIEDAIPQQEGNGNWGSIHVPFNCPPDATLETCPIQTNTKFNTIRNFTHYIRPGDRFVGVSNPSSVAALKPSGNAATVVHVNNGNQSRSVRLDLSGFGTVSSQARVTPVVSSAAGGLVQGNPVRVVNRSATLTVPAKSVTTFLVTGVRGVAPGAALVQPDHAYRLTGVQSNRSLAPAADQAGLVIRTTDAGSTEQLWSVRRVSGGVTNRERFELVNVASGRRLAVRNNAAVLEVPGGADPATEWVMSTTGDGTWTFVNVATGRLLDVVGQATGDGSRVSTFTPTSGANQRWAVRDETVQGTQTVETYTVPGLAPQLPATVTPVYRDGARGELPVSWTLPPDSRWRRPGTVRVHGEAIDVLGQTHRTTAVVTVDTFSSTVAGRAKTYVGGSVDLPATVVGVGDHCGQVDLPVTWEPVPAFDEPGVTTVTGTAQLVDGSTVPATARVQVTAPVQVNAALADGVAASATFTEDGYSPDRLRNGDLTDKGWSNWKPTNKNPSDTITLALPAARQVNRVVTRFFRDGSNISFADTMRVQVLQDGSWVDASGEIPVGTEGSPVIDVPVSAGPATAVRVVMTARPDGYITLSEIEVYANAPGVSSDPAAASIEVDGVPVAGFDPEVTDYRVPARHPDRAEVTVTPRDPYATVEVDRDRRRVEVTLTSEDGTQTRTYEVRLARR
jgi:O-glycosyl hydrolase